MNLDSQVYDHYDELTETDRYIWQYIKGDAKTAERQSITELAASCHVSPTAITRFSRKIGLSGFGELKMALKWQQSQQQENRAAIMERCMQDYVLTMDYLKRRDCQDYFRFLDRSKRLFAYGTGEVQRHAAKEIRRLFLNALCQVYVIEGTAELDAIIPRLGPDDGFFFFSLSGNNAGANERARKIKEQGASLVAVTSYEENELAGISDVHFYYYNHLIMKGESPDTDAHLSAPFFMIGEVLFIRYLEHQSDERQK